MSNYNRNKGEEENPLTEPATKPKPGDYDLGSLQSRAAARALIQDKESDETVLQVVFVSPDGTEKNGPMLRFPRIDLPRREAERIVGLLHARLKRSGNAQS